MTYDIIIIGGGPSGLMASIAASSNGAKVLLVDKGDKLGRKLGISGGGRCNVTNNKEIEELIKNIPGNGKFLYSALHVFKPQDIVVFFEGLGIRLKEEDHGRMFPVTDKAKTVVGALLRKVREQGVETLVNQSVEKANFYDGHVAGVRLKSGEEIHCHSLVIATGGKSVPHTGSTGDGYAWAKAAGHTITELYPTEVPITSREDFIRSKQLQGLSLRNIGLSVWNTKGKKIIEHEGDMIFTHFGVSGPAALRCSQFVVKALRNSNSGDVLMSIDLFPDKPQEEILTLLQNLAAAEPKKAVKNILKTFVPERLALLLLDRAGINGELSQANIPKSAWLELAAQVKKLTFRANGTLSIEEAFVTGGGVNLKEIDPRSMQSKLMPGLFFCGEILDIHGYTGGYNITAAFSTGYTAGMHAAEYAGQVLSD